MSRQRFSASCLLMSSILSATISTALVPAVGLMGCALFALITGAYAAAVWAVLCLLLERFLCWRLALDSRLFAGLSTSGGFNLASMDSALHQFFARSLPTSHRSLSDRWQGTLRLLRFYVLSLLVAFLGLIWLW